jgi:hypothetical protein
MQVLPSTRKPQSLSSVRQVKGLACSRGASSCPQRRSCARGLSALFILGTSQDSSTAPSAIDRLRPTGHRRKGGTVLQRSTATVPIPAEPASHQPHRADPLRHRFRGEFAGRGSPVRFLSEGRERKVAIDLRCYCRRPAYKRWGRGGRGPRSHLSHGPQAPTLSKHRPRTRTG